MTHTLSRAKHLLGATALTAIFSLSLGAVSSYAATSNVTTAVKTTVTSVKTTANANPKAVTQLAQLSNQDRRSNTRNSTSVSNSVRNANSNANSNFNSNSNSNFNSNSNSNSRATTTARTVPTTTRSVTSRASSNSSLSNSVRSVILNNSRNFSSRSNSSRSSSSYSPRIASHSFGRYVPTSWSYSHNGFQSSYRSSIGISFSFGTPGYSQYRWAPSQYGFYNTSYGSLYSYRAQTQCQRIVIDGIYRGALTPISVVECYTPWDGHYIIQGTERVEYGYATNYSYY